MIIYILTNESMPDYIKIGRTKDLKERLTSLNTTALPLPFEVYYARRVQEDVGDIEKRIHFIFDDYRKNKKREFFVISPDKAQELLKIVPGEDYDEVSAEIDEVDKQEIARKKDRKSHFNFKMVEIPIGAELTFSKAPEQKVQVKSEKNIVELNGEEMTISAAALKLNNEMGNDWKSIQGAAFFEYNGETLTERRERMED